ncbi:distal membrane-arm assembly complex protein 2-like [Haliotis cracherodii]|uniref:distal membrane-arm assembly complex protein 2-like n=1 Tax=Haliotis cracherodii TaxID=6455 RepID=UPI0039EAD8D3
MAALIQHVQRALLRQKWLSSYSCRNYSKKFYDKREGVPNDFLVWLQRDYDWSINGIRKMYKAAEFEMQKRSQKYLPERHEILGPDLATSHFIVKRGGAVKFVDRETWFRMEEDGKYYLPNRKVEGMKLEAVDASNTSLMHIGMDNFVNLSELRYLSFSNCPHVDDWCMSRLHTFKHSLEFLDISGCDQITEDGLACLHHLEKLKGLKLSNLPNVKHLQLMVLLLEESLPECMVFGVDFTASDADHGDVQEGKDSELDTQSREAMKTQSIGSTKT